MYVLSHHRKKPSSAPVNEHAEMGQLHNYNSGAGENRKEPSSVNASVFADTLSVVSGRQQRSPPPRSLSPRREQEQDNESQTTMACRGESNSSRSVSVSSSAALSSSACAKTVLVIDPETSRPRFIHNGAICSYNSPSIFDKLQDPSLYTGVHKHRFDSQGRGRGLAGRDSLSAAGSLLHFSHAGRGGRGDSRVGVEGSPSPRRSFDKTGGVSMRSGAALSGGQVDPSLLLDARTLVRSGAGIDSHIVKSGGGGGGHGDGDSKGTRWATSLRATTHHFTSHQTLIKDGHCRELYRHTSRLMGESSSTERRLYTFDIDGTWDGYRSMRGQTANGATSNTNNSDVSMAMNVPTVASGWRASPRFDSSKTHTTNNTGNTVRVEKEASHARGSASIVVDGRNCCEGDEYDVEVGRRKPKRETRRSISDLIPSDASSPAAFNLNPVNRSSRLADFQQATCGVTQGSSGVLLLRPTQAFNTLSADESTILGIVRRVAQLEELNAQAEDNNKQPGATSVDLFKYTTMIDRSSSSNTRLLTPILEPLVASTLTMSKGVEGDGKEENTYIDSNSINGGDVTPEDLEGDGAPHSQNNDKNKNTNVSIRIISLFSTNEQQQQEDKSGDHQQDFGVAVGQGREERGTSPPRPPPPSYAYVQHVSTGRVEVTSSELWRASCAVSEGATTGEAYTMAINKY